MGSPVECSKSPIKSRVLTGSPVKTPKGGGCSYRGRRTRIMLHCYTSAPALHSAPDEGGLHFQKTQNPPLKQALVTLVTLVTPRNPPAGGRNIWRPPASGLWTQGSGLAPRCTSVVPSVVPQKRRKPLQTLTCCTLYPISAPAGGRNSRLGTAL